MSHAVTSITMGGQSLSVSKGVKLWLKVLCGASPLQNSLTKWRLDAEFPFTSTRVVCGTIVREICLRLNSFPESSPGWPLCCVPAAAPVVCHSESQSIFRMERGGIQHPFRLCPQQILQVLAWIVSDLILMPAARRHHLARVFPTTHKIIRGNSSPLWSDAHWLMIASDASAVASGPVPHNASSCFCFNLECSYRPGSLSPGCSTCSAINRILQQQHNAVQ